MNLIIMENIQNSNQKNNSNRLMQPIIPTPYITLPKQIYQHTTTIKHEHIHSKQESLSNLNLNVSSLQNKTISALINQSKSLIEEAPQIPKFYQENHQTTFRFQMNHPQSTKSKSPSRMNNNSQSQIVRQWTLNQIIKKKLFFKSQERFQNKLTQFKNDSFAKIKQLFYKRATKMYNPKKMSYQINAISFYMTIEKVQAVQCIQKILNKKIKSIFQKTLTRIKYISEKELFVLSNTFNNNSINNQYHYKDGQNKSILKNQLQLNSFLNSNIDDKQTLNGKTPYSTTQNTRVRQVYQKDARDSNHQSANYTRISAKDSSKGQQKVHKISHQLYISIKDKSSKNFKISPQPKSQKSLKLNSDIRKAEQNSQKDSQCSIQFKQQSNFQSSNRKNKLNSSDNIKDLSNKQKSQLSDNLSALILNMNQIKIDDYYIKTTNQIKINSKDYSSTDDNIQINCHTNLNFSVTFKPQKQDQSSPRSQKQQPPLKPESPQFLPIDSTANLFQKRKNNQQNQKQKPEIYNSNENKFPASKKQEIRPTSHSFDDRLKFSFCPVIQNSPIKHQNNNTNLLVRAQNTKVLNNQQKANFGFNSRQHQQPFGQNNKRDIRNRVGSSCGKSYQRGGSSNKITFNFVNQNQKLPSPKKEINYQQQYRKHNDYFQKPPQPYQLNQIKIKNQGSLHIQQKKHHNLLQINQVSSNNNGYNFANNTYKINFNTNLSPKNQYVLQRNMSSPYFTSIKSSTHFTSHHPQASFKNQQNSDTVAESYGLQNMIRGKQKYPQVQSLTSGISSNTFQNHNYYPSVNRQSNIMYNQNQRKAYQKQGMNKQLTKMKNSKQKILVTSAHKYKYT